MDTPRISYQDKMPPALWVALPLGMLSICTASILVKLCPDAPAVVIACARLGISSLVLIPGAFAVKGRRLFHVPRQDIKYILLSSFFLSGHFLFWFLSLKHTSVLSSVVIVASNPLFVGLASYVFLKEKIHCYLLAGILLGTVGGIVIGFSDMQQGSNSLLGDLLSFGGAIMASSYFLIGRKVRGRLDLLSYITPVYAITALILLVLVVISGGTFSGYRNTTYVYFVLLAVFPQLIGHTSINWSLKYITATTVAVMVLVEPVGSAVLAYFFLGEGVTVVQVFGSGLILAGIFFSMLESGKHPSVHALDE